MKRRHGRFILLAFLALASTAVYSCGRKTDPLTPDSPRPEAVKDIKAVVRDNIAFLSWRIPVKNIEGNNMDPAEIKSFRIFRAEFEREGKRPRYRQAAEIETAKPFPSEVKGGVVYWRNGSLRYGQAYIYRIRAVSMRGGVSPYSDEARVTPILSLAPPKNVSAVGKDGQAALSWEPVIARTDGSKYDGFVGYNIYRGPAEGKEEETPLNREPVRTNAYNDTAVMNGVAYYYVVRSVDSPAPPWKESLDSSEVQATPRDFTPPAAPEGLTVVPGVGRIFLTWGENRERDIAGYHVYRTSKSGREYARLTDKPINRTTYSDESVAAGTAYYYIITAVDQAGNEGPASKEQKAVAERLR